jgi:hypothetical protein
MGVPMRAAMVVPRRVVAVMMVPVAMMPGAVMMVSARALVRVTGGVMRSGYQVSHIALAERGRARP